MYTPCVHYMIGKHSWQSVPVDIHSSAMTFIGKPFSQSIFPVIHETIRFGASFPRLVQNNHLNRLIKNYETNFERVQEVSQQLMATINDEGRRCTRQLQHKFSAEKKITEKMMMSQQKAQTVSPSYFYFLIKKIPSEMGVTALHWDCLHCLYCLHSLKCLHCLHCFHCLHYFNTLLTLLTLLPLLTVCFFFQCLVKMSNCDSSRALSLSL